MSSWEWNIVVSNILCHFNLVLGVDRAYVKPRHKKPNFQSTRRFLETLGIFRKKWDFGVFLDDLEQKLSYILSRFI